MRSPWWGGRQHGLSAAPARRRTDDGGETGQATVEFAFLLPVLALLVLAMVQIGLVVRAKILTVHGAREAARAAAVDDDPLIAARTSGLAPLTVSVITSGQRVTATVSYIDRTDVPLVGILLPDVVLTSNASMRKEDWPSP